MVIEPRVVQFWSEIILVISNRTRAARSFDFENHAYGFSPNCTPLSTINIIKQAPDCQINSPFQTLKKCIMNSMKNMHTDVRVKMINLMTLDGFLINLDLSNY